MNAIVKEPASVLPVTMLEALQHIHNEDTSEDLSGKLAAAVASIELQTGPIMHSDWLATFSRIPKHRYIHLPAYLVTEVISVADATDDGETTVLVEDDDYVLDLEHRPGRIRMLTGINGTLRVEFTAGWVSAAVVPPELKHAILLEFGHMHAHREGVIEARPGRAFTELPRAIQHLTARFHAAMQLAWSHD